MISAFGVEDSRLSKAYSREQYLRDKSRKQMISGGIIGGAGATGLAVGAGMARGKHREQQKFEGLAREATARRDTSAAELATMVARRARAGKFVGGGVGVMGAGLLATGAAGLAQGAANRRRPT